MRELTVDASERGVGVAPDAIRANDGRHFCFGFRFFEAVDTSGEALS